MTEAHTLEGLRPDADTKPDVLLEQVRSACDSLDRNAAETNAHVGLVVQLSSLSAATLRHAIEGADGAPESGAVEGIQECGRAVQDLEQMHEDFVARLDGLRHGLHGACDTFSESLRTTEAVRRIAEESRVLALNGRIEARRAGERGRGFEVVAEGLGQLSRLAFDACNTLERAWSTHAQQIGHTSREIADLVEDDRRERASSSRRIQELLAVLQNTGAALEGAILAGTMSSDEIAQRLADVMTRNQDLDRRRQIILAACEGLAALAGPDPLGDGEFHRLLDRLRGLQAEEDEVDEEPELF